MYEMHMYIICVWILCFLRNWWVTEIAREFRKDFYFIDYAKAFACVDHNKLEKRWEYQTILPVSWETCMRVKKQQLAPDMKQLTGSELGKE